MTSFCCCEFGEEFEEYAHPSGFLYRNYMFLRYSFPWLFTGYTALTQWLEGFTTLSPAQGETPVASSGGSPVSGESTFSETSQFVPRPLPFDAETGYPRVPREGLVSRRDKSSSHFLEESQAVRRSNSCLAIGSQDAVKKQAAADIEESKAGRSESEKALFAKASYSLNYVSTFSEDEDVCPTCLEEYTLDNPKIVTRCSHHFHLGCIYEWMERSDNCPLCGKEMDFKESP